MSEPIFTRRDRRIMERACANIRREAFRFEEGILEDIGGPESGPKLAKIEPGIDDFIDLLVSIDEPGGEASQFAAQAEYYRGMEAAYKAMSESPLGRGDTD